MKNITLNHITSSKIFFYILSPLILLIPAFYNGYPLVFSDTGTYIMSGMELVIPTDRPIMYGLFIRFFSLGFSLWPVIYMQSLILLFCIWQIFKFVSPSENKGFFLLILFGLSCFSGLGWYSSQLMPDIFSATAILALILIVVVKNLQLKQKIILSIILSLSIAVHFSNIVIIFITLIGLILINAFLQMKKVKLLLILPFILMITSVFIVSVSNYIIGKTFKINQGSHVFLMGKMLDAGVLQSFLNDKCSDNNYILCDCMDSLPENSRYLLWDSKSPLHRSGGWTHSEEAYNKLLRGIFSSPKHILLFSYHSFLATITQLFQFDIGSGLEYEWYRSPHSPPYIQISKHFPFELNPYKQSRQNGNLWDQQLNLTSVNHIYRCFLIITFVGLVMLLTYKSFMKSVPSETRFIIMGILIGIFANAAVVASLANVYDRLQGRISWMVIFAFFLLIIPNAKYLWTALKRLLAKN